MNALTYVPSLGLYMGMNERGQLITAPPKAGGPDDERIELVRFEAEQKLSEIEGYYHDA